MRCASVLPATRAAAVILFKGAQCRKELTSSQGSISALQSALWQPQPRRSTPREEMDAGESWWNPRKSTSDDFGPTPLLNPVTPPAPDAVTFAGTRRSSQARRRSSPAEVCDSVEVAAPRRNRRHSKCVDSTFRTDAAIPDFAHRLVFTLHQRDCTWGSTRLRVRRRWCRLVGNDSATKPC
ncbi:hypothetical protein NDU88_005188 [Pleurodeles waltl]|uniref:Uncharacterized protein n=1 Tax=Pleurodeles waltl TaxID=8319 RepID=A0AAV7QE39_PLEWA|nr:hypothetical protein NDU88_005188 [Pleurodeles waltl]